MSDFITNAELRIEAERLCDENEQLRSEKAALERRIDELCEQVEYDRQTSRSRLERIDQLKDENDKLRELAVSYDSALHRMCDQAQRYVDCHDCILGKNYGDDSCAIDELREAACAAKVELDD